VRPLTVIPALRFPDTSTGVSTHYYFHVPIPPVTDSVYPVDPSSDPNNSRVNSLVAHSDPMSVPFPLHAAAPVSMRVAVVRNSVWPVQSVRATYSATSSTTEAIAFAPRLQESPQIVFHPNAAGAMQRRLIAVQRAFPQLRACEAISVVDSLMQAF